MRCNEARSSMVLGLSGDCAAELLAAADDHAASCLQCAAYRSTLRPLPLQQIRAELPLTETELAGIRGEVMRILEAREAPAPFWLRALAPVTAALLMVLVAGAALLIALRRSESASGATGSRRPGIVLVTPTATSPIAGSTVAAAIPAGAPEVRSNGGAGMHSATTTAHSKRRHRTPSSHRPMPVELVVLGRPAATFVRIELQTSDPNIRIIWIANQSGMGGNSEATLRSN